MCRVSILFCHECRLASQIFRKNIFYNQLHAIPIVNWQNWFLKVLSMPIPLYSMWQVYQTCSLRLLRAPTCCKKKKKKEEEEKQLFFYTVCMFVFILTVSVSPTPMYIQTKTNVSQHFPFLSFPFRKKKQTNKTKKQNKKNKKKQKQKPRHICVWKIHSVARCCLHSLRLTQSEV